MLNEENCELKASVIIPIYNAEKFLEECLQSILNQTISQSEIEVLMISDGSTDSSNDICKKICNEYRNFIFIEKQNSGVSSTRNLGIKNAKGKYIFYIDADDSISENTIEDVCDFFDEHYDEIDIVSYPTIFCSSNGNKTRHYRDNILKNTKVYDIEKTPYVNLTTINMAVKNLFDENILFDENFEIHEDIEYQTNIIMQKGKFGYVVSGRYFYRNNPESASNNKISPFYIFDPTINFYTNICEKYQINGGTSLYIQNLVLSQLSWKIKIDKILPYHLEGDDFQNAMRRIKKLFSFLNNDFIVNCPYMSLPHKFYLFSFKEKFNFQYFFHANNEVLQKDAIAKKNTLRNLMVLYDNQNLLVRQVSSIEIVVNRTKIENGKFYILAYLKDYFFESCENIRLSALLDDENYVEIPLKFSQHSCFNSNMQTNYFLGFEFEIAFSEFKELKFIVHLMNHEFTTRFYFSERQSILPSFCRPYLEGKNFVILFKNNKFVNVEKEELKKIRLLFVKNLFRKNKKAFLVRLYCQRFSKRKIWIYRDTYNALDNAYYQFIHDFEKKDGVLRYYICDFDSIDCKNKFSKKQRKFLIQQNSRRHKKIFFQADKHFYAFASKGDFVPIANSTLMANFDLIKGETIYLQHGVMHASLPNMYSKEKIFMVDKVVVSTEFEANNLQKLFYRPCDILKVSMPRFDHLEKVGTRGKKILFAPSWRTYLVSRDVDRKWNAIKNFEESDYFLEMQNFLKSELLSNMLKKFGFVLEIKLHPNFECYQEVFRQFENENVCLKEEINLNDYKVCITDFSSFMYDFLYLGIPVITCIFDEEKIKAGLHNYRELSWNMKKDYPLYCKNQDDIFVMLEKLISNDESFNNSFKNFMRNLFFSYGKNHSEELYRILKLEDK